MKSMHRRIAVSAAVAGAALGLLVAGTAGFIRTGIYNVGADDPHYPWTHSMLEQLRNASIRRRAAGLVPPPGWNAPERIVLGSGNYEAMCTSCHLAPGSGETELSRGLYPRPPNLSRQRIVDPSAAFWTIRHGIKGSGMPAWGASMDDGYIWSLVAFLQVLPTLDESGYRALVAKSAGHSHGAPTPHAHAPGTPPHDDSPAPSNHDH